MTLPKRDINTGCTYAPKQQKHRQKKFPYREEKEESNFFLSMATAPRDVFLMLLTAVKRGKEAVDLSVHLVGAHVHRERPILICTDRYIDVCTRVKQEEPEDRQRTKERKSMVYTKEEEEERHVSST